MRASSTRVATIRCLLTALALHAFAAVAVAAAADAQKQVLVLYSTRRDAQISIVGDRELPVFLEKGLANDIDYYSGGAHIPWTQKKHVARVGMWTTAYQIYSGY